MTADQTTDLRTRTLRALGALSPLGHDCRTCGTVWPGMPRSASAPAGAA
ncbi:hypothetical protein ACIG0C_36940 [Kitasatospora aureofaciens]|nr:hypothetical protein [Kitasatospora aureofaciens]